MLTCHRGSSVPHHYVVTHIKLCDDSTGWLECQVQQRTFHRCASLGSPFHICYDLPCQLRGVSATTNFDPFFHLCPITHDTSLTLKVHQSWLKNTYLKEEATCSSVSQLHSTCAVFSHHRYCFFTILLIVTVEFFTHFRWLIK